MKASLSGFPAYGRTYKTQAELKAAFLSGLDFSASYSGGPYFSIRDFTDNDNCKDFDGVIIVQPASRGTLCAVSISRREMCDGKAAGIKQNTSDSSKDLSVAARRYQALEKLRTFLPFDRRGGSCVQGRGKGE
jgi:hypothetical protein